MHTAVGHTDKWMRLFGMDVEEIEQWEIVRRYELVAAARASAGCHWLEKYAAGVHYDGDKLTPGLLERQVRSYFPAGGASLHHLAAPGTVTLARLSPPRRLLPHAGNKRPVRVLPRRSQRETHAPEHLRVAPRLLPYGRLGRFVAVPLWRQHVYAVPGDITHESQRYLPVSQHHT